MDQERGKSREVLPFAFPRPRFDQGVTLGEFRSQGGKLPGEGDAERLEAWGCNQVDLAMNLNREPPSG